MVRVRPGTYIEGCSLLIVRVNIYPVALSIYNRKRRGGEVVPLHKNIIINSVCLSRQELYFAIKSASAS